MWAENFAPVDSKLEHEREKNRERQRRYKRNQRMKKSGAARDITITIPSRYEREIRDYVELKIKMLQQRDNNR